MKIAIVLVLMTFNLTFFGSCVSYGQLDTQANYGTADSGGANVLIEKLIKSGEINPKLLETYKINPKSLIAYKSFIKPWLESTELKGSRTAQAFQNILDKKVWYLVPAKLKKLSSSRIAAPLDKVLRQAALQDFKQVWISDIIFKKLEPAQQSLLLVHELFMGLRLLKYDTALAECLAFTSETDSENLQHCYNGKPNQPRGKPYDLTKNDYAEIRNATALVAAKAPNLTFQVFESILGSQGFLQISPKKTISLQQLGQMIATSKLIKIWPKYGYDFGKFFDENQDILTPYKKNETFKLNSDTKCDDINVNVVGENISISTVENGKSVSYSHRWTAPIEMHLFTDPFVGLSFYHANFNMLKANGETAKKGEVVANLTLKFLTTGLMGMELIKTICTDDDCSSSGQGIDGYQLLCYTRKSIQFNLSE